MPSLPDGIVIFVLALLLFGPKKLPVLARELGKWIGEFRRASNEFKLQMEDELRLSEQADRQKEIAAMEAAAPIAPALGVPTDEPEHPHLEASTSDTTSENCHPEHIEGPASPAVAQHSEASPLPIATSGELSIMPPATGLPVAQSRSDATDLSPLLDSIPPVTAALETESQAHG